VVKNGYFGTDFVINRGFEKCLVMYPLSSWQTVSTKVKKLNTFKKKHREFVRYFFRGASDVGCDGNDRILVPKQLQTYAGITKDIVLFGHADKIEIWDKQRYDELLNVDAEIYADLADEIMNEDDNSEA